MKQQDLQSARWLVETQTAVSSGEPSTEDRYLRVSSSVKEGGEEGVSTGPAAHIGTSLQASASAGYEICDKFSSFWQTVWPLPL